MNGQPPINVAPDGLEMALMGIGGLCGLIALVCAILVGVKMIQHEQKGLGIATIILCFCTGIGQLIALIYGWMKAKEWNMKGLMMALTVTLLGSLLFFAGYVKFGVRIAQDVQQQIQQDMQGIQQEMPDVNIEFNEPAAQKLILAQCSFESAPLLGARFFCGGHPEYLRQF